MNRLDNVHWLNLGSIDDLAIWAEGLDFHALQETAFGIVASNSRIAFSGDVPWLKLAGAVKDLIDVVFSLVHENATPYRVLLVRY